MELLIGLVVVGGVAYFAYTRYKASKEDSLGGSPGGGSNGDNNQVH